MGIGFTGCNQGTPVTSDNAGTTTPLAEDTTTPPAEDTTTPPVEDTTDELLPHWFTLKQGMILLFAMI